MLIIIIFYLCMVFMVNTAPADGNVDHESKEH